MSEKLAIFVCNTLVPEIKHVIDSDFYPDVVLKSYPTHCMSSSMSLDKIGQMISECHETFDKVIFIASGCMANLNEFTLKNSNIKIVRLQQCFETVTGIETIYHFTQKGYYLATNGWLRTFEHHKRNWGFERKDAHAFFRESMKKIMLLDTGIPGNAKPTLEAFSDYTGLEHDTFPIGLAHCKHFIHSLVADWRAELERKSMNKRITQLSRELADNSVIMIQLKELVNYIDEQQIVNRVIELMSLLFVPEQIVYTRVDQIDTWNTTKTFRTTENSARLDSDSFTFDISNREQVLAKFDIINVKNPQFRNQYIATTSIIRQFTGLAIANARRYSELLATRIELAESEEKYRFIAENTKDVIWVLNLATQKFTYISPSVTQLTGFSVEEAMQQSIADALSAEALAFVEAELPQRIEKFYSGDRTMMIETHELQQRCKSGELIWVEFTTMFKLDEQNAITDIYGVSRNIDSRKKDEIQISLNNTALKELNQQKDKFFSIIAHDIRSPFNAFLGLTELMADEIEHMTIDELQHIAVSMKKSARNLYNLLSNLLEWSRMQRGLIEFNPALHSLTEIVSEVIPTFSEMADKKNIAIHIDIDDASTVYVDKNMLETVIRNLLTNAIKFSEHHKTITLSSNRCQNGRTEITVIDQGIGIPEETLNSLFVLGNRASQPGTDGEPSTGLGLLLCKEYVDKNNGAIRVESTPGVGSSFLICLPAQTP
jgi:PAS domain S-box-containing protein